LNGAARSGETLILGLEMAETAHAQLGAPQHLELRLTPGEASLELAFVLRGKPANRMPEASFVHVTPINASRWTYRKMGLWQPGDRIARHGGGQLQAVSAVQAVVGDDRRLEIVPLDTPLVAPVATPFMPFCPTPPDLSRGIRFNLHNNKWGTNFPMWWEGDLVARFVLRLAERFDH
jgi:hypothetical protein